MNSKDFFQLIFMFWDFLTGWIKKTWKLIWCWANNRIKEECEDK